MEKENTYKENVWVQNFSLLRLKEHTTVLYIHKYEKLSMNYCSLHREKGS